ncbi:hypothetical protein [Comamonas sp.]|uniref:hypothetical protein n=1 Tax=Comamonas sp. TaxID=34028 RepID=UPI003A8CA69D
MRLDINTRGLQAVQRRIDGLSAGGLQQAQVKAVNDVAYQNLRPAMAAEMQSVFDRPTPYIMRSPWVQPATDSRLYALVAPRDTRGGGVDPQKILDAQVWGGRRGDKRSEVALKRAGILPAGYQTAIPDTPFPGSEDGFGNLRGAFLVQVLSYLQAFGERGRGHHINMKDPRKRAIEKNGGAKRRLVGPSIGRRYIVAYGKMRGGARWTAKGENDARASNLAPGIWAVVGRSGADIRPVVMFVKAGRYTPRFDMDKVAVRAQLDEQLAKRMRFRIRQAAGV